MNLKYDVKANAPLKDASVLEVELISVDADGVGFKIDGGKISIAGLRKVSDDFEASDFQASFDQAIETPDIVLKQYKKMQEKS